MTIYPQDYATGDGTESNPWANDCIKKAYDACPNGGTIYLRAGYYQLAGAVWVSKTINIIGEGRDKTFIITADNYGFHIDEDYITCKGFTIDGAAQINQSTAYCFAIADCSYITLEDIEVKNCGRIGINILNVNHSLFQNIYAHDCSSHGMHPGADTSGRNRFNTYRDIYAWNNSGGFDDWSSVVSGNNTYDNLNCWNNSGNGIALTFMTGITLFNSSASGNSQGIMLDTIEDSNISNCLITLNGAWAGLKLSTVSNTNFTNVIVKNESAGYSGIFIELCTNLTFTSCQSYDDRVIKLQEYGLRLYQTNTGISLLNCKLSPNLYGEIYNPNNIPINIS